jgi:hypothetical protein
MDVLPRRVLPCARVALQARVGAHQTLDDNGQSCMHTTAFAAGKKFNRVVRESQPCD